MPSRVIAVTDDLPLAEQIRASQLPPPEERRAIRQRAGASLKEVATEVGVTATAVMQWERGRQPVSRAHAIAYRRVLDSLREAV